MRTKAKNAKKTSRTPKRQQNTPKNAKKINLKTPKKVQKTPIGDFFRSEENSTGQLAKLLSSFTKTTYSICRLSDNVIEIYVTA